MNDSSFQTPLFAIGMALILAVLLLLGTLIIAVMVLALVFPATTPAA